MELPSIPQSICIVDDDADFIDVLGEYAEARGLCASFFKSAEELLNRGQFRDFDLFLLDLGLPGIDGVDLCSMIRADTQAGILVVSGRMGPDAFNSALNAGADMFINKPVRLDQIYNAMSTIYRRSNRIHHDRQAWRLALTDLKIIPPNGTAIVLSGAEVAIINRLHTSFPEPVSREELAEVSGINAGHDCRNLDAAIFRLRRKIEREAGVAAPLRTERGRGYRLATALGRVER